MAIGNLLFLKQQAEMQGNWSQAERFQAMINDKETSMRASDNLRYDKVEDFTEVSNLNRDIHERLKNDEITTIQN